MDRRVSKGEDGSVGAVVVAVAAMERLGWTERLSDILDPLILLPQAGQGAVAVQCRTEDAEAHAMVAPIDHAASHRAVRAERAVLAALGGSCSLPVAAWGTADGAEGSLVLHGLVASGDGRIVIRMTRRGDEPDRLGAAVAAALLDDGGAGELDGFDRP
jgi:hydroxymethylbilane synthase